MTAATTRAATWSWDVRHAFRLQRFEVVGFAALVVVLSAAVVGLAGVIDATGYGSHCDPLAGTNPVACEAMGRRFYDLQTFWEPSLRSLLLGVPFIGAVLLGVPIVARELERGTGRLAWSLAPSRPRWFLARVVPIALAVIALALVAGLALDRLMAALEPWTDEARSFDGFGSRGVVLAARVAFVFAIAVASGAVVGRSLPAILVAIVVAAIAISGGSWVHARWIASEAVLIVDETGVGIPGALFVDQRLRDPAGRILTWDEAYAQMPADSTEPWPPADWTPLDLVVPGERAPFMAAREVAALTAASVVFLLIAGVAVTHHRPG